MSLNVLVIDKDAGEYAVRLKDAMPGVSVFPAQCEKEALAFAGQAEVLIGLAHVIGERLVAASSLRWIQALTTGTDHLWTLRSLSPDVIVTSARGIHGPQMAEMAFLYMISLSRNFRGMLANQQAHRWERWPQRLLLNKTAVLVGVGAISEEIALRCKAFGMRVVGISSARTAAWGFDIILPRERLADAAGMADFLIALVPYEAATHHLIGGAVLDAMREDAILINLARGSVIDEQALIARLRSGRLRGAGLDVFETEPLPPESPLWDMDNVIVTPRVGGMSDIYVDQVLPLVIQNLHAFAGGRIEDLKNVVRRPTVGAGTQ